MGWSGIKNGALLRRASLDFDVFLTIDKSIQHQQVIPDSIALITLRAPNNRPETVIPLAPHILEALTECAPGTNTILAIDLPPNTRR
jgi:hypothetical protein